jgi:hypothetical protein
LYADGRRGAPLELHPGRGPAIKDEPGTLIWRETLPDGTDAAVKLYLRGFGSWLRSRVTAFRARHEFDILLRLDALGITCAAPLFWAHGRFSRRGWGEMLVTKWVPDSRPLTELVGRGPDGAMRPDISPVFSSVAMMHGAGLRHGTLLARNILVQGDPASPRFFFIDMPRSHMFPRSIRGTRMALYDLLYFCDSLAPHFGRDDVKRWLTSYGMPETQHSGFLAALEGFRNTSRLRRLIGAEFNIRNLAANMFATPSQSRRSAGR